MFYCIKDLTSLSSALTTIYWLKSKFTMHTMTPTNNYAVSSSLLQLAQKKPSPLLSELQLRRKCLWLFDLLELIGSSLYCDAYSFLYFVSGMSWSGHLLHQLGLHRSRNTWSRKWRGRRTSTEVLAPQVCDALHSYNHMVDIYTKLNIA
jgi:hypothetical protein